MSISSSAVVVELNISVWTANKLDREATDTVAANNAAGRRAIQVRKDLMAGSVKRKTISDYASSCRNWHSAQTIPWADRGPRLLPSSLFLDYKQEMNSRRTTFFSLRDTFVNEYPTLVGIAQNNTEGLGRLFNPDDYPTADAVRDAFDFRLVFSPVPSSGDFRVDVPAQDLEEIKQQYDEDFQSRLGDAMKEPWDRLHKLLTHMSEKLTEGEDEKRYRTTLVTNAQSLCSMLTHLNVTKDPELEKARRLLENTMTGLSIGELKEDPHVRSTVKRNVDAILKQFEW